MMVNAYVVSSVTTAVRPRVQRTSYASPQNPEAAPTASAAPPAARAAAGAGGGTGSAAEHRSSPRLHASAVKPTATPSSPARVFVSTTPRRRINTQPVTRQPRTAPAVFAAYRAPAARPAPAPPAAANRVRTGKVPPMRTVGGVSDRTA